MLKVSCTATTTTVTESETLVSGRVGLQIEFSFSSDWDGLQKIACFRGESDYELAIIDSTTITVPHEALAVSGYPLYVGAVGKTADGTIVIPTTWCKVGRIQQGVEEDNAATPQPPTPDVVSQIQQTAANARATSLEAIDKAVTAETAAITAQDSARNSALSASASAGLAYDYKNLAQGYQDGARDYAADAQAYAEQAATAKDDAVSAKNDAVSAKNDAVAAKTSAEAAAAILTEDVRPRVSALETGKADKSTTYTKTEVNTALSGKANTSHTHVKADITDLPSIPQTASDLAYGESNVADALDTQSGEIANKQDTLTAGTGITISNNVISATGGMTAEEKRKLDALWMLNEGVTYDFETDSTECYSKSIPTGAFSMAMQSMGGKSEVHDGTIVHANTQYVKIEGLNKFNPSAVFDTSGNYASYDTGYDGNGWLVVNVKDGVALPSNFYVGMSANGSSTGVYWAVQAGVWKRNVFNNSGGTNRRYIVIYMKNYAANWSDYVDIAFYKYYTTVTDVPAYTPYTSQQLLIPNGLKSLQGYGQSNGTDVNTIDFVNKVFHRKGYYNGETWVASVEDVDISSILAGQDIANDAISVEGGGTITFVGDSDSYHIPIPNSEKYIVKLSEVG